MPAAGDRDFDDIEHAVPACGPVGLAVAFRLDGQRYALPIERVQEIQQIVAFSEVPSDDGAAVVGMVDLRGLVIPAVDVRALVGLPAIDYSLETPMVIARLGDGSLAALVVDEVLDVIELPEECLQEAPALHTMADRLAGVARLDDGLAYVVDLDRLVPVTVAGGVA